MDQKDYYQILGVEKDATPQKIKEAYRDLAFKYHPDRNASDSSALEKMQGVNEAYAVLSNPEKKREYDTLKQQYGSTAYNRFRKSYTDQDIFQGSDVHQVFEEMAKNFGVRGFDEIFKQFEGQGYRRFETKRPGLHVKGFVFSGWLGGGKGPFFKLGQNLSKMLSGGTGAAQIAQRGPDIYDVIDLQPAHAHQGGPFAYYNKKRNKKLVVQIPAYTREGQKIRLSRMGEQGRGGGMPGDLFLKVNIKKPLIQQIKGLFGSFSKK
jgi:DnaJ-class molecular chaperone